MFKLFFLLGALVGGNVALAEESSLAVATSAAVALPEGVTAEGGKTLDGQGRKGLLKYHKEKTPVVIRPVIPRKEVGLAKAVNVSQPIYLCAKPGYVLRGEKCVFIQKIRARRECPIGYTPVGGILGRPDICERITPPTLVCPRGRLGNGFCHIPQFTEPIFTCPPGTELDPHGDHCIRLEPVMPEAKCPDGTTRLKKECVLIEYLPPNLICPDNSIPEGTGDRCRVEILTTKKGKKGLRQLTAGESLMDGETQESDNLVYDNFDFEDMEDGEIDLLENLPEHVYQSDFNEDADTTWLPASGDYEGSDDDFDFQSLKDKLPKYTKKFKKYDDEYVHSPPTIAVEVPIVAKAAKLKQPKPLKVKLPKIPEQVIRIDYIPAKKVCEVGSKVGSTCLVQTIVEPILECPVTLIHGRCARRVVIPGVSVCSVGKLVCPPRIGGRTCQCETIIETSPLQECHVGRLIEGKCVAVARPKEYCPIGSFLDRTRNVCIRKDVEPALCMFTVTYICPNCDQLHPSPISYLADADQVQTPPLSLLADSVDVDESVGGYSAGEPEPAAV